MWIIIVKDQKTFWLHKQVQRAKWTTRWSTCETVSQWQKYFFLWEAVSATAWCALVKKICSIVWNPLLWVPIEPQKTSTSMFLHYEPCRFHAVVLTSQCPFTLYRFWDSLKCIYCVGVSKVTWCVGRITFLSLPGVNISEFGYLKSLFLMFLGGCVVVWFYFESFSWFHYFVYQFSFFLSFPHVLLYLVHCDFSCHCLIFLLFIVFLWQLVSRVCLDYVHLFPLLFLVCQLAFCV